MGRRLLLLVDAMLLLAAVFLGVRLYETWSARPPAPPADAGAPAVSDPPPPPRAASTRPPLTAYAVIAERNLFSSTRTEAPPEPTRPTTTAGAPPPPGPRPRLHGVVLLPEGRGRAYLEDVQRRRVHAYSVGDQVGDSRLEQIRSDRVVLRRGAETFEVLLYDPAKPRQSPTPAGVQSPEAGGSGRPVIRRPPTPAPSPGPGVRAPGRPRAPAPAPAPTQGAEEQEPNEEE